MTFSLSLEACRLCPRRCGADRLHGQRGRCGAPAAVRLARAALHGGEEPCLGGEKGAGAVFFSCCSLQCCFCQNHEISAGGFGREISARQLADVFLSLQAQGAQCLDLVTATPYLPMVLQALAAVRGQLDIPVVYNTGGYELPQAIEALAPYVDVWLPDLKFFSPQLAGRVCGAPDYFAFAGAAVAHMVHLAGPPQWTPDGRLRRGVLVRHLVLPGQRADSKALLDWLALKIGPGRFVLSLMRQYTPCHRALQMPPLDRRVSTFEYNDVWAHALALGLNEGYSQSRASAQAAYIPPFDLAGVP